MSFQALHLRTIFSFNFMIKRLLGCRFCSGDSKNGVRSQVFAQKDTGSVIPEGKDLELAVSCLRVDRVIASGLGIGRRFVFENVFRVFNGGHVTDLRDNLTL